MKRLLIITLLITLLISVPSCGDRQAAAGTGSSKSSQKQAVKIDKTKLTMTTGSSRTIRLKGAKASRVKWSSSKKSVAAVSKGRIKAKKAGKATIIAKYKGRRYKCRVTVKNRKVEPVTEPEQPAEEPEQPDTQPEQPVDEPEKPAGERELRLTLGSTEVQVEWKDNESVAALKEMVKDKPLTIQMSMYGGLEQVGSLGARLPRNDAETTTDAGDIVLYSGNQIVVFYGSNSWAYTRLGHITDKTKAELKELLGNGDIKLTISM